MRIHCFVFPAISANEERSLSILTTRKRMVKFIRASKHWIFRLLTFLSNKIIGKAIPLFLVIMKDNSGNT